MYCTVRIHNVKNQGSLSAAGRWSRLMVAQTTSSRCLILRLSGLRTKEEEEEDLSMDSRLSIHCSCRPVSCSIINKNIQSSASPLTDRYLYLYFNLRELHLGKIASDSNQISGRSAQRYCPFRLKLKCYRRPKRYPRGPARPDLMASFEGISLPKSQTPPAHSFFPSLCASCLLPSSSLSLKEVFNPRSAKESFVTKQFAFLFLPLFRKVRGFPSLPATTIHTRHVPSLKLVNTTHQFSSSKNRTTLLPSPIHLQSQQKATGLFNWILTFDSITFEHNSFIEQVN